MEFRIAGAFTGSLARLPGSGQKAVKTAAVARSIGIDYSGAQTPNRA